ncbi:hypothetical protein GCM10022404_13690 [Celeribacter arenosi]|uniref:Uncharacterized protein n=2 Tax=Celeribacter arenosi TaxID=792649 RepID=A0ABP7K3I9_9RHOB
MQTTARNRHIWHRVLRDARVILFAFALPLLLIFAAFLIAQNIAPPLIGTTPLCTTTPFAGCFSLFVDTSFAQALLGASYGAIGALAGSLYFARRAERRATTVQLLESITNSTFVTQRREAAEFLHAMGWINPDESPSEALLAANLDFRALFSGDFAGYTAATHGAGITALRAVLARLTLVGDMANAHLIDTRIAASGMSGFLASWLEFFNVLDANTRAGPSETRWRATLSGLAHLRDTFGPLVEPRGP